LDLLGKILVFNPENRITIEKILKHPYLAEYHDESLEYKNNKRVDTDGQYNSMLEIRQYMYDLISKVHADHKAGRKVNNYYERYTNYNWDM